MIKDKLDNIYKTNHYRFCNIDFELYPDKDLFRIYDKIDGNILYENFICKYNEVHSTIKHYILQESAKEELRKISEDLNAPYAVCFYLGKPKEIVEGPILVDMKYIS